MKEVLEFIKANWQLIIAVLVFILSFILQLKKKKPINDIISILFPMVVQGIAFAEEQTDYDAFDKSHEKLQTALSFVLVHLCEYFGLEVSDKNMSKFLSYRELIIHLIESILDTPQKKGGSADGEKKTHDEK